MSNPQLTRRLFVAVHAGAGFHSSEKETDYKLLCKRACMQAMALLTREKSAAEAVTSAVKVLEDSELTNAGRGSSLTMQGTVECDASVMDGASSLFGAVGCISGIMNPVQVAHELVVKQRDCSLSHGRVPPSILVGDGAREWAKEHGFSVDNYDKLITDRSKRLHRKYKRKIAGDTNHGIKRSKVEDTQNSVTHHHSSEASPGQDGSSVQDTVGAVCIDFEGNVSAAVSSGGIWLKQPGRLGPAAVYGAGCWAVSSDKDEPAVAVITSGCGEHIMRTLLAKTCAESVQTADNASQGLSTCFQSHFLASRFLHNIDSKLAGAMALKFAETDGYLDSEVVWGHTTDSMAVGYMSDTDSKPKALISRLAAGCQQGKSFTMSGAHYCAALASPSNQDQDKDS